MDATSKPISRRRFLKIGCLSAAAMGITVCGGAGLASALTPDLPPIELTSFSYGGQTGERILIAYASATGSTMEIAAAIGETLGERGFSVDVRPIKDRPSVEGYQSVLIGSPVQGASWVPEAIDFVRTHQSVLNSLPLALFAVHFFFRGDSDAARDMRLSYLDNVRPLVPQAEEVFFGGRFDQRTAAMGLPAGMARLTPAMDVRDWEAIGSWAQTVFA